MRRWWLLTLLLTALTILSVVSIQLHKVHMSNDRAYEANLRLRATIAELKYSRSEITSSIEMLQEGRDVCEEALQQYTNNALE